MQPFNFYPPTKEYIGFNRLRELLFALRAISAEANFDAMRLANKLGPGRLPGVY